MCLSVSGPTTTAASYPHFNRPLMQMLAKKVGHLTQQGMEGAFDRA